MSSDTELQNEVQAAFKADPILCSAEIGIVAKDSVITLTGAVDFYGKKAEAGHLAMRTPGVKAVIESLSVDDAGEKPATDNSAEFTQSCPINF